MMAELQTNSPNQADSRVGPSHRETETEISDTKGLFKPHLFKALLAKAKSGLDLNKGTPCITHK
ncbi:hypothetical protein E2320_014208 [Naja naja]|nr:hypothetical protein E2320_014208 [Naja naja]